MRKMAVLRDLGEFLRVDIGKFSKSPKLREICSFDLKFDIGDRGLYSWRMQEG